MTAQNASNVPGSTLGDDELDFSGGGAMGIGLAKSWAYSMNGAGAAPGTEGAGEAPVAPTLGAVDEATDAAADPADEPK